jgi:Bacterial membrane protein YfhO
LAQGGMFQPTSDMKTYQTVHEGVVSETTTAFIVIMIASGLIFARLRSFIGTVPLVVGMILLQFIDINIFGFDQNNAPVNPDEYFSRNNNIVQLAREEGATEYFRINSRTVGGMLLDRNQGMIDRIFLMEGYTPMAFQRTFPPGRSWDQVCDMLNAKYRTVVDEQQRTMQVTKSTTYLPRAWVVYRTGSFTGEEAAKEFMEGTEFEPSRVAVLEEPAPVAITDTSYDSSWSAKITSYKLNEIRLDVSMPKSGYLVVSEMFYPGWNVYIAGKQGKILRADWNLRAIPLEQGTQPVVLRYEPSGFQKGFWISSIASVLCVAGFIFFRKRPSVNSQPSGV